MDGGIALLELANQAGELFERQPAGEKRRLLEFLLSNSCWADGELTPQFRQPFDLLKVTVAAGAQGPQESFPATNIKKSHPRLTHFEP